MAATDRESIAQCLNGHPDSYRQLVGRYQATLLSFLIGKLGNRERAEEAAQEAFVRAYFALAELRRPESFFSWLLGIADRVAKEEHRHQRREQLLAQASAERPAVTAFTGHHALETAVASLAEPYREVVLLRYHGGKSCAEIADQLAVPLGTVTKRLSRAYAQLRESLRDVENEQINCEVQP